MWGAHSLGGSLGFLAARDYMFQLSSISGRCWILQKNWKRVWDRAAVTTVKGKRLVGEKNTTRALDQAEETHGKLHHDITDCSGWKWIMAGGGSLDPAHGGNITES